MRSKTKKISSGTAKVVAHRGLAFLFRENTLFAFENACKMGYSGIECDIHVTKDNKYYVFHDDNLKRVCGIDRIIEEMTSSELDQVKIDGIHKIPTLAEWLDVVTKYDVIGVLEYKNHFAYDDILKTLEIINSKNALKNIIFISFDLENCINLKKLNPNSEVELLCDQINMDFIDKCNKYSLGIDANCKYLNKKWIKILEENNIKSNSWTVNSRYKANLLKNHFAYITTNVIEYRKKLANK